MSGTYTGFDNFKIMETTTFPKSSVATEFQKKS